jgi:hypothetical protein
VSESRGPLRVSHFFRVYPDESTTAVMITKAIRFLSSVGDDYEVIVVEAGRPTGPGRLSTTWRGSTRASVS